MHTKLAARVLAAALLAALLNIPANAAPAPGRSGLQVTSWWDWLERLPQRILIGCQRKIGGGLDPDGLRSKAGPGIDPDGLAGPSPTVQPGGEQGSGWDPNG